MEQISNLKDFNEKKNKVLTHLRIYTNKKVKNVFKNNILENYLYFERKKLNK